MLFVLGAIAPANTSLGQSNKGSTTMGPSHQSASAFRSIREWHRDYHIGVEVECKIAEAISPRHYEDGFHSTGTCGTIGPSAAAAKVLGLDRTRT